VTSELFSTMLIPALGGLAVGFPSGLLTGILATLRWAARRRERGQTVPIYTDDNNPTPGHVPLRSGEHLSKLGWFLALVGVAALIMGATSVFQSNSTSSCLQHYIQRTSATNQQRAEAAALDRQGLQEQISVFRELNAVFIESIKNPPADPAQARTDFLGKSETWDARLAKVDGLFREAEVQRAANPVPPQPTC
jgi:hypothetical protein